MINIGVSRVFRSSAFLFKLQKFTLKREATPLKRDFASLNKRLPYEKQSRRGDPELSRRVVARGRGKLVGEPLVGSQKAQGRLFNLI